MYFPGYWVDLGKTPAEVIPIDEHNSYVQRHPEMFGLMKRDLDPAPEGRAANVLKAMRKGFVRVRGNLEHWSVEFYYSGRLLDWVRPIMKALPRMGIRDSDRLRLIAWNRGKPRAWEVDVDILKRALKPGREKALEDIFGDAIFDYTDLDWTLLEESPSGGKQS